MPKQAVAEVGMDGDAIFVHFQVHVADGFIRGLADNGRNGFVWEIFHHFVGRSHRDWERRGGGTGQE